MTDWAQWISGNAIIIGVFIALFCVMITAVIVSIRFKTLEKALHARLTEMERYRRREYANLTDRVEGNNARMHTDLQLINQLLSTSANANEERIERMLSRMSRALDQQQTQMTQMRETVDQKLEATLEKRLGESFRQVSEQLERVYKGLGEMQRLAGSVGDLKRVLAGVKTRGVWGEVRLQALLDQTLTKAQYVENTTVAPDSRERVEFAVVLPGKGDGQTILLPIDAKFPQEDYQRLTDAAQAGNKTAVEQSAAALERTLMEEAKRISDKYIRVPYTTDFAILFLPTEGLYAEALRRRGLCEKMQEKYRVLISGPTTLSALLSSLQMGFQTLAVEQRSEEIWRLLGSVRAEFMKFGEGLERTRQRLEQANAELDATSVRTRQITRRLSKVDELTVPDDWKRTNVPDAISSNTTGEG